MLVVLTDNAVAPAVREAAKVVSLGIPALLGTAGALLTVGYFGHASLVIVL